MSERSADDCLSLLREGRACYARLAELSQTQRRHVEADDAEALVALLRERQAWADRAVEIDRTLADVRRGWPDSAAAWTAAQRDEAATLFAESRQLLEELTRRDAGDLLSLQRRRHDVGRALERVRVDDRSVRRVHGRYAASAYGAQPKPSGRTDVRR